MCVSLILGDQSFGMGIVREVEECLLAFAAMERRKQKGLRSSDNAQIDLQLQHKLVCVTSGASFLGLALVNCLLLHGYTVRLLVDSEEEVEKLREMEVSGEIVMACKNKLCAVIAKPTEIQELMEAFDGCGSVFHTSAFADPAGISGYSKSMGEIEVKGCENVMKACARTASVRNCVLTSSLLACIWRHDLSPLVNHDCWSDESFCRDKKLWYALGKLRAERVAWKTAEEMGLKLTTICPGLITGPEFSYRYSTPTIAYLKGAQEMYRNGVLATVDVNRLAESHVSVYEAMDNTAYGRYICFDNVIEKEDEAEKLAMEMGIPTCNICGNSSSSASPFELSNSKLTNLIMSTSRRCYGELK